MFERIKAKTTESFRSFAPKATIVQLNTCMCCRNWRASNVILMGMDEPDPMMIFCNRKKCIQEAYNNLYTFMTQFKHSYVVKDKCFCKVKRSNGDIEENWHVSHIVFDDSGIYCVFLKSRNLNKGVLFKDFVKLNEGLKETVENFGREIIDRVFEKFDNL
jgi:hypothetical protein